MKKRILTILFFVSGPLLLFAQSQNALDFDGIDDQVIVQDGSQYIAGSSQISLTFWVYPKNNVTTFPDYDGFAGFRNNSDGDFYIVQLPGNTVECRLRNSTGAAYDVVYSGLILNTWQHFALTYDGATLTLYHNGVFVGSQPASGVITNSFIPFLIGNLPWTSADFLLYGQMDEVSLWNTALTAQEVACIYSNGINTSSSGLDIYFDFNQGIPGGTNTAITSLTNSAGILNGSLNGFQLSGNTSNFVAGIPSYATPDSATICQGDVYLFGSQTLTTAGVYTEAFPGFGGCDSLVALTLNVNSVDTSVTQIDFSLTSNQANASYQWLDCQTGYSILPGDTLAAYDPPIDGTYAVAVTYGGCTDTSSCYTIVGVGITELHQQSMWMTSANPVADQLQLNVNSPGTLVITDVSGRIVKSGQTLYKGNQVVPVGFLRSGIFIASLYTSSGVVHIRFMKR
ncbi:MAG TPA: LamG-like jellyroll fold domain-containing protein [Bacteroidia bacterium]|nr:LamG-like jellyroll fold domain-containing protein [Bacteroidia bacterium]